ncbi:MAG: hypothetical protein ACRDWV_02495 [Acidimicrobiales bacterium]
MSTRSATPSATGAISLAGAGRRTWILTSQVLGELMTNASAARVLATGQVLEILAPGQPPASGLKVVPTARFASLTAMRSAFATGSINPWIGAVLYDDEAWPATPEAEQRNPAVSMASAATLVHRHHLLFVAAPALDLASVLAPKASSRSLAYLGLDLAGKASKVADVIDIQAQSIEGEAADYLALVERAAAQARAANRSVIVLSGLSTNPPAGPVSADQLRAVERTTESVVSGYWLNVPSPGPSCPRCGPADPALAAAVLSHLPG